MEASSQRLLVEVGVVDRMTRGPLKLRLRVLVDQWLETTIMASGSTMCYVVRV